MLLIGSGAARAGGVDIGTDFDLDYICTIQQFEAWASTMHPVLKALYPVNGGKGMVAKTEGGTIFEFSIAWEGTTNAELLALYPQGVAPLDVLLMLKLSHRYKKNSPHFLKTMQHIKALRAAGANVSKPLAGILKRREKETYTYSTPKLAQGKASFFRESDGFYKYEHDDIHMAVAVGRVPAYTEFPANGQEVYSSKQKWDLCDQHVKLLAGLEESYVLAIERSLVPHPGVLTPKQAFDKALEKVCTSITSGWFREFCWENYDAIQALYDASFYHKFLAAVDAGQVRAFASKAA